jgi:ParB-like nuclease domain
MPRRRTQLQGKDCTPLAPEPPSPEERQLDGLVTLMLSPELVSLDAEIQPRTELSTPRVNEYAELYRDGQDLGALLVFRDGNDYWLADGFHRWVAARQAGLTELPAEIRPGSRREAMLAAAAANKHGLPRATVDKRRVVLRLLEDVEWRTWSDREIARHCGVSHIFVAQLRKSLTGNVSSEERTYRTKHGTTATMQTANIGKRPVPRTTVKAEMAAGKSPKDAVKTALRRHGVGLPTPALAAAICQATDRQVTLAATDGNLHDGRTKEEESAASAQTVRWYSFFGALETLATLEPLEELAWEIPEYTVHRVEAYLDTSQAALARFSKAWQVRRQQGTPVRANGCESPPGEAPVVEMEKDKANRVLAVVNEEVNRVLGSIFGSA